VRKDKPSQTDPVHPAETDQPTAPGATPRQPASGGETPQAPDTAGRGAASEQPAAAQPAGQTVAAAAKGQEEPSPLESLRAELHAANDRALRMQAELDNYRKRAARELQEERRYANLPLMRDLVPVLDNLDRAIGAAEKQPDGASLLEGVKLVARQFEEVLGRHHCVRIQAHNEPFDPHLHEAVSQQPSDEHPAGTVLLVTQAGYQLHDRVVRPSQVIVSGEDKSGGKRKAEEKKKESQ
jgi:molecular chaperone GrpE